MLTDQDWRVFKLAKKQHGVVSYKQLEGLGVQRAQRRWRLGSGEWIRELPGVVRLYWADKTWLERVWATSLWAEGGGLISHETAGRLLGLDVSERPVVEVVVAGHVRRPARWIHPRATRWPVRDKAKVNGLSVTAGARTLVDLTATMDEADVERVARQALREGVVRPHALRELLGRLPMNRSPMTMRAHRLLGQLARQRGCSSP